MAIQGEVAAPAALKRRIDKLNHRLDLFQLSFKQWKAVTVAVLIGLVVALLGPYVSSHIKSLFSAHSSVSTPQATIGERGTTPA